MNFWREEFSKDQITLVLKKIREVRSKDENGNIVLKGIGQHDAWIAVLVSALGLQIRTNALRNKLIHDTLFSPELSTDFTEAEFRCIAYQLNSKYQSNYFNPYRVVFPIWNLPSFLKGTKRKGDVTINLSPSENSKLLKNIVSERDRQRTSKLHKYIFTDDRVRDLNRCSLCLAKVRASSPSDANERASQELYEVFGLVNMAADWSKYWRISYRAGGKLPISEVLIGPHTTTHFEDGKLTHDGFWHEEWVGGPGVKTRTPKAMQAWETRFQRLASGIAKSRWRDDCKAAAARYFKAFSNPNLEESFLEGWRLFENISGSRYEKIKDQIRRASNIFENNSEYYVIGQHLALRRNMLAHGHAIKVDDEEILAFQMLQFVIPFLERYILNGFEFSSRDEFWRFLDLPAQRKDRTAMREEHEKQLDLLAKAAKFRGEPE